MKPIRTDKCNFTYKLTGGTDENDLPCLREDGKIYSTWEALEGEALSLENPHVSLFIFWPNRVGCSLRVGDGDVHVEGDLQCESSLEGGEQIHEYVLTLSDREAQVLRDGGHVEAMVDMMPPPPVAVILG